jgi:hypothetical protein
VRQKIWRAHQVHKLLIDEPPARLLKGFCLDERKFFAVRDTDGKRQAKTKGT